MAGEWATLPFSDAVTVNPSVPLQRGVVYPFVAMQSVDASSRCASVSEQREYKGGGSRFAAGDTLMARITPCLENGKIARFCDSEAGLGHGSTEFIVIRGKEGITDSAFAYYLTRSNVVREYAISQMTGTSGRQRVPTDSLDHLTVVLPPLPAQRAIAQVLGTLDDKIELNRRMNEALETMARSLFKSWFVDFDPVRAKATGRDPGLPEPIAALFPDHFENLELGEIPAGWRVGALRDLCEKPQYGYTASASAEPIGPKFLRITDINKRPWIEWTTVPHCEISDKEYGRYQLHTGDVLIARMADPGHGVMIEDDAEGVFASYLIRFRPKDPMYARYIQYWLRSARYWELVNAKHAGTTRASLNAQVLGAFQLAVPARHILHAFGEIVAALRSKVVANVSESRSLTDLRDALLPPLISGELRLTNPEGILGSKTD